MNHAARAAISAIIVAATIATPATIGAETLGTTPASAASTQCTASSWITQPVPALKSLQSTLAWTSTQGAGTLVAVVDSGVNQTNPHLTNALKGGTDLVGDGTSAGGYSDLNGHGTALAGIIAARTIDNSSVQGLAPQASILSVRVFANTDDDTVKSDHGPNISRLADGIRYAADQHAQIINVSLSTPKDNPDLRAATQYATAHGSLLIAAAGNRDSSDSIGTDNSNGIRYPAGYPGVIGVAAANDNGTVTKSSIHGKQVSLSAPGQNILTTSNAGADCIYSSDTAATSFATAYVSASAALVAAAHPDETPAKWAYRLEASAVRTNADSRDNVSGWGLVQPYDAITLIPGDGVRGPASPFGPSNTTTAGKTPTPNPAHVSHHASPTAAAKQITIFATIGAAAILAILCILAVARNRKNTKPPPENPDSINGGLYGNQQHPNTTPS